MTFPLPLTATEKPRVRLSSDPRWVNVLIRLGRDGQAGAADGSACDDGDGVHDEITAAAGGGDRHVGYGIAGRGGNARPGRRSSSVCSAVLGDGGKGQH